MHPNSATTTRDPLNSSTRSTCPTGSFLTQALLTGALCAIGLGWPQPGQAVPMVNDPQGFHGIPWGTDLVEVPSLVLAQEGMRINSYELKEGAPSFGEAKVDSVKFSTVDGQFARVTVRYRGKENHERILAYLQAQFGPLDQTPGQTMTGVNQQYNWRGLKTEINMTYQQHGERGFMFIESRELAPKFLEFLGGN